MSAAARRPLIESDSIVFIEDLHADLDEDYPESDPGRYPKSFWVSCAVTWVCCLPLGVCALYSSVTSLESEQKGDFLRAAFHRRAALRFSVAALLLGGVGWAALLALLLLRLNGVNLDS